MRATALVTTTINIPRLLADYARDAKAHGREVKLYVAGDRKTPSAAAEFCAQIPQETGVECEYMSPKAQTAFLRAYPALAAHLPWDCIARRNVGLLKALADGAEVVITIDDDNFLAEPDYFGAQLAAGDRATLDVFGNAGGWFNVCRFLEEENGRRFFPRGYGMAARSAPDEAPTAPPQLTLPVAVNAGLWLGDPDIDAATRLAAPVQATAYTRDANFFVTPGCRTPFNSQNTALARDAMGAYFLSPFVGRHDDIFASYIVKRIADHLGHGVAFGRPLVRQDRNAHDLLRDLALENLGMKVIDDFVAALDAAWLTAANYADCLLELCPQAEAAMREVAGLTLGERAQLAAFFAGCRIWGELGVWR